VRVSVRTIERVRQRFVEDGLEAALLPRLCNDNCDVRSATIRLAGLVIADGGRHGPTTISGND
jgi:hypothetical protein